MTHPQVSDPTTYPPTPDGVLALLPAPRLNPYIKAAPNNSAALSLYEWSSRMAATTFEDVGHLEILFREALDRALRSFYREAEIGIPWFMMPTPGGDQVTAAVDVVRSRLRQQGRETRDQIVAGLSFGFWSGLVGPKYDDLWRRALHGAFQGGDGTRKQVSTAVEHVRKLRNRLAHHDSMVNVDIPFEIRRVYAVAGYIHPDARAWLEQCSRAMAVYAERPSTTQDTVVVPAREAWPFYQEHHAYVCQPGRTFRPVERLAFYADQEIKTEVPRIYHRRDDVEWTEAAAAQLEASSSRDDVKIARIILATRKEGWTDGSCQVFLLSRPGDPNHRALSSPLHHDTGGRGTAFVQGQRYVSLHSLEIATSTRDLMG